MSKYIFTSPGIKFRERDLTFTVRNIGLTTLGLVGETLRGPAFEPVFVADKNEFKTRFGGQSTEKYPSGDLRYQAPYVANAYLEESGQLQITRVLGLEGYNAGTAWAITLSAGADYSTSGITATEALVDQSFTDSTFLGVTIQETGVIYTSFSGFTKTGDTTFVGIKYEFSATTLTNGSGDIEGQQLTLSASSYSDYENMVLAVLRSRATVTDNEDAALTTLFNADIVSITANATNSGTGDLFEELTIVASSTTDNTSETYITSLNPNSRNYLPNLLGRKAKDQNTKLYVDAIYPDLIKKLDADQFAYGINDTMVDATSSVFTDYTQQYQTPETPYVVSELRGNQIQRLFKFISISDGDSANKEVKYTIQNVDPVSKEFDVVIRDFNDTDDNPVVLESFTRCSMRKSLNSYVGKRIGTSDGDYSLKSKFAMLEIDENAPEDAFPAGFEGYYTYDWSASATSSGGEVGVAPKIMFKTSYSSSERLNKAYLGISEKAYNATSLVGTGFNPDFFKYIRQQDALDGASGFIKSKGFHMDSGATGIYSVGEFEVGEGAFRTVSDISSDSDIYGDARSRKFNLVPAGGFDGWNIHRQNRSNGDLYKNGGVYDNSATAEAAVTDYVAWETAINTFANPEEVTINLFATPAINWSDNLLLVKRAIEMIEEERGDSLYIIDSPDINQSLVLGKKIDRIVAEDIVDLLETADIDSNYSTTYYPWIQIFDDQNNVNIYLPPTGEVVKAIAHTDNVKFPWFAPAGMNRGVTNALKSKYKMSLDGRDILYKGRINPMADFSDTGTVIWGQKTLQVADSALNRVSVRRLLLQVKVLISNIAIRLLFDQNDDIIIEQFLTKANPVLERIRRERGLSVFRIKMDESLNPESNDRNELYGEIFLTPVDSLENIGIGFTITPAGASFANI